MKKTNSGTEPQTSDEKIHKIAHVDGMYKNWFLDYASYVILERAVPAMEDGLKPVQRRILHSMKEMDDGRFNKVANIIGQTMQYHPHGDAAIGDALVNLGQKELLIETQGNWGDIRTGDRAAAPRYIEARLSKFALEVAFNPDTTQWQVSYDGRKNEPVTLPVKFPMLLAQGVEGIAVGLATKILPHNFNELIHASIDVLKGKKTSVLPDFPAGGMADFSNYNQGKRGGKVRLRAKIEGLDKKTLVIKDIPYGITTTGLMDSITKASENKKLRITKVTDNTAKEVEILVHLPAGVSPDISIGALYAFTDCEVSVSPNCCVIVDAKPQFLSVDEILKISTGNTIELLKLELEIKKAGLAEKWHFSSLEKIFIQNRIYRDIEQCETWESVIETIDKGLDPFKKQLKREVTRDDIIKLTEIRIKRISKYDSFKADELIKQLEEEMVQVNHDLAHLTDYAITYFEGLLKKYGKDKDRKTEIKTFDTIAAERVAAAVQKLYVNRQDGFIGYGLKKDEFVCDCSELDNIIVFRKDGKFVVTKIAEKTFVGKDIIHLNVWKKDDQRMVYNMIYLDAKSGKSMVKRFSVTSVTRDKEYDLTKGSEGSRELYFTANPNGESEIVTVLLIQGCRAKKKVFDYDFSGLAIKGRGSQGNVLTKYPVKKIIQKSAGISTIGGRDLWFDETIGRLNNDSRGKYLGNFNTDDLILVIYKDGCYELTTHELINRYDADDILIIEKFDPEKVVISAIYYDGSQKEYYIKRFKIETLTAGKKFLFISERKGSKLILAATGDVKIEVRYKHTKTGKDSDILEMNDLIDVKGWRAMGNKLSSREVMGVKLVKSISEGEEEKVKETIEMSEEQETPASQIPPVPMQSGTKSGAGRGDEAAEASENKVEKVSQSKTKTKSRHGKKPKSSIIKVGSVIDFSFEPERPKDEDVGKKGKE